MNLRPRKLKSPELNVTPLIDVVFLLLIFFMVSTSFERETQIQIELPRASGEEMPEAPPKMLDVVVDRQGRFYVNQEEVVNTEVETLKRAIAKAAKGETELPVVITADAQTPHQAVITVMDAASQLGYVHIVFAARQPESER